MKKAFLGITILAACVSGLGGTVRVASAQDARPRSLEQAASAVRETILEPARHLQERIAADVPVWEAAGQAKSPSPCPSTDTLRREWVEHGAGVPPMRVIDTHLENPLGAVSPGLIISFQIGYWIGMAQRTDQTPETLDRNLGCHVVGSVAYYYNGTEGDPQRDIVGYIRGGDEWRLGGSLLEMRWYDPADGLRHRWFNVPLARRTGIIVDEEGQPHDDLRPLPLPPAVNSLY